MSSARTHSIGVRFPEAGRRTTAAVLGFVALLCLVFADTVGELLEEWTFTDDYRGAPLVVLGALVFYWWRASTLSAKPVVPTPWGLGLVCAGIAAYLAGIGADFIYVKRLGLWFTLGGVSLVFWGSARFKHLWIAWAALFFALPFPPRAYTLMAQPLHGLAMAVVQPLAEAMGLALHSDGWQLWMPGFTLPIPEALGPVRALPMAVGGALLFTGLPRGHALKLIYLAATVPTLVGAAVLRLLATAWICTIGGAVRGEAFFQATGGRTFFAAVLVALAALAWSLRERRERSVGASPPGRLRPQTAVPHGGWDLSTGQSPVDFQPPGAPLARRESR